VLASDTGAVSVLAAGESRAAELVAALPLEVRTRKLSARGLGLLARLSGACTASRLQLHGPAAGGTAPRETARRAGRTRAKLG